MSSEVTLRGFKVEPMRPGTKPPFPNGPVMQPQGKRYLGRVVIEVWEPNGEGNDGTAFIVQMANGGGDGQTAVTFAKDALDRIRRRLGKLTTLR